MHRKYQSVRVVSFVETLFQLLIGVPAGFLCFFVFVFFFFKVDLYYWIGANKWGGLRMSEEVPDRVWWTMLRFIFISFGEQQKIIDERQWQQKFLITLAIMLEKKKKLMWMQLRQLGSQGTSQSRRWKQFSSNMRKVTGWELGRNLKYFHKNVSFRRTGLILPPKREPIT